MSTKTMDTRDVVNDFTNEGKVFSAFDVTTKLRAGGNDVRHYAVKNEVHSLYNVGAMDSSYDRQLITLDLGNDDADAWVYYPTSKTPYDHPLAKKQTVQVTIPNPDGTVPVVDLDDDTDEDDDTDDDVEDSIKVTVTKEKRINIPKKLLKSLTPDANKLYDIHIFGEGWLSYKKNADGRVRVTVFNKNAGDTVTVSIMTGKNAIGIE